MSTRAPFAYQGSKLKELPRIKNIIKNNIRIAEPFFGSGIITGEMGVVNGCIANDLNTDIFKMWECAVNDDQKFFDAILEYCKEENRYPEYYYERREEYNAIWRTGDFTAERTALYFYLLNSCHAAMVRYGPNGFNTPYKLFLSNGRYYNVESRVKIFKRYAKKIRKLYNVSALDLLKRDDLDVDVIYCDPPYINSGSVYQNTWNEQSYLELQDVLKYQWRKNSIPSITSNYSDPNFDDGFDSVESFSVHRFAGTETTYSNDILGFIGDLGKSKIDTLEGFFV